MKSIKLFLAVLLVTMISTGAFAKDPGDTVNDFTIKNFDGKEYKLSSALENGYVVVMFWSAECPYVQPFNDRINDYVNAYIGKGFTFWAINSNVTESTEKVKEHYLEQKYVFPVLKDDKSVVADLFEAKRTPEVFVLNKDRKIMYHGRIDDNSYSEKVTTHDLKNALDEILAGKEITNKTTKSFGCTIKRD
ncbi:MAG: thioredoxin family protein [Ignavibacteriota bacterium]|nr:thioredoxin family protein [Ignavibacteriota bacterium]